MDKETLQKKIESGDTVWGLSESFDGEKEIKEFKIKLDGENVRIYDFSDEPLCPDVFIYSINDIDKMKWLFATKEEAEWQLEFGNIERREKLELPTWEQAQENIDWGIDCANRDWYLLKLRGHSIIRIEDWNSNGIYEKPLTYENYLEACRLCKKLFLGEKA